MGGRGPFILLRWRSRGLVLGLVGLFGLLFGGMAACTSAKPAATPTSRPASPTAAFSPTYPPPLTLKVPYPTPTPTQPPTPTRTPTLTPTPYPWTPGMPTPTPRPVGEGVIEGLVWRDECILTTAATGDAPPGCRIYDQGMAGDGYYHDEPGIPGVQVVLRAGRCPGNEVIATTVTDEQGRFVFTGLASGYYCVEIPTPQDALGPGFWTAPKLEQGYVDVHITWRKDRQQVAFGWFPSKVGYLPTSCTNVALFVEENMVPAPYPVPAGAAFRKSWRVRNGGTCAWTTDYRLRVVEHTWPEMARDVPLPDIVWPGEDVVIELPGTAPSIPGFYSVAWKFRAPNGETFGLGYQGDGLLWLRIYVPEIPASFELGEPVWTDLDGKIAYWLLPQYETCVVPDPNSDDPEDTITIRCVSLTNRDGHLLVRVLHPVVRDRWFLSTHPPIRNGYLEGTFEILSACDDDDRYGFIVRSPKPNQGVIVEVACARRYRIYQWRSGAFDALRPWTFTGALNPGGHTSNRIGVWMEGGRIRLYINRFLVTEVRGVWFLEGKFGVLIHSVTTPDFRYLLKDLRFWSLPGEEAGEGRG
ncbi:MAG: hypothetical protein GXO36_01795 [Chloroflexi bacterium]|nr:hypothetical protein [Chloroflexota bacterium]